MHNFLSTISMAAPLALSAAGAAVFQFKDSFHQDEFLLLECSEDVVKELQLDGHAGCVHRTSVIPLGSFLARRRIHDVVFDSQTRYSRQ